MQNKQSKPTNYTSPSIAIAAEKPQWQMYIANALSTDGASDAFEGAACFNLVHHPEKQLMILGTITVEPDLRSGGIGTAVLNEIISALPVGYTFRVSTVAFSSMRMISILGKLGFAATCPWFLKAKESSSFELLIAD